MPDDIHVNLNDLSQETVQILVKGVAGLLSAFADSNHDGPLTLSPELVRELDNIVGIEDVGGLEPWEELCVQTGFHTGVFATVACIGILLPEFRERLRELERSDATFTVGEDGASANGTGGPDTTMPIRSAHWPH